MTRIALSLAFLIAVAAPAAAQSGHISGVLSDPSGAVLPGVQVRAAMKDNTGETTRTVHTDGSGRYDLSLTDGAWMVTASLPGFANAETSVELLPGATEVWSPRLRLGSLQETITITQATRPGRSESPAPRPAAAPTRAPAAPALPGGARGTLTPTALPPTPPGGQRPVRVGGNIKAPHKIVSVNPGYPADAAAQGISGVVILECTIGPNGRVTDARTLRSPNDSLTRAATDAVRGWEFTPTLLNGTPVPVIMTATFNFRLD